MSVPGEAEPCGDAGTLELRADLRTALRFYALMFAVSSVGVAACVIVLVGATARSVGLLAVQILALEAPVHFGLAGVFWDFYRGEKSKRWVADGSGVRLSGEGAGAEFISWGEVGRILMEGHYIGLVKGTDAEPRKIFFVAREARERFYKLYLFKNVYPIADPLGPPRPDDEADPAGPPVSLDESDTGKGPRKDSAP